MTAFKNIVILKWNKEFADTLSKRKDIDKQLDQLEEGRNRLFDLLSEGKLKSVEEVDKQVTRLRLKQEELEQQRKSLSSRGIALSRKKLIGVR